MSLLLLIYTVDAEQQGLELCVSTYRWIFFQYSVVLEMYFLLL